MLRFIEIFKIAVVVGLAFIICSYRSAETPSLRWVLLKGGSLSVKGKTNVNEFTCSITGYANADTLFLYNRNTGQPFALQGQLDLPVKLFNCKNPIMTADLRKTLKAKTYPDLSIRFLSLSRVPIAGAQQENIKGNVEISLAGKKRRYEVNYTISISGAKIVNLLGERNINFTDFDLEPPSKLGGMIKTENQLNVQFRLTLSQIN